MTDIDDQIMTDAATVADEGATAKRGFGNRPNAIALARDAGVPVLDVVVPVFNEQVALRPSVRRLHCYVRENFPFSTRITIADNASVDATPRIAAKLADELDGVRV